MVSPRRAALRGMDAAMAHQSLKNHRKLKRLMKALKVSKPTAMGLLEHFWLAVYECWAIEDGTLSGWSTDDIAESAAWDGNVENFVTSMVESGFIDTPSPGVYAVHDYLDWCPFYVKKRVKDRQEGRKKAALEAGKADSYKQVDTPYKQVDPYRGTGTGKGMGTGTGTGTSPPRSPPKGRPCDWDQILKLLDGEGLNTPAFRAAWEDWATDRRERGKSLTKLAITRQIKTLESFGHDRAIESIGNSIESGWQKLVEPRAPSTGRTQSNTGSPARYRQSDKKPPADQPFIDSREGIVDG